MRRDDARFLLAALATTLLPALLTGCSEPAPDPTWESLVGETALAKANCLACHAASEAARERLKPVVAPLLSNAGGRLTPEYMRKFIADPLTTHRSTRMPDVLHGLKDEEKKEATEDLVQFLVASKESEASGPAPVDVLPAEIARGESLYRSIGCSVCHGKGERGRYAQMTWHAALAAFISDPTAVRPGGLMPNCHLAPDEARAVAAWLLEAQGVDETSEDEDQHVYVRSPGLLAEYYEVEMTDYGVPDGAAVVRSGVAAKVDLALPHREDEFAFRFVGEIEIPKDGSYTFYLASDDGSTLDIDGKRLIDNGGPHSFSFKQATVDLTKGWHPIVVRYWEISVDNDLRLEWSGPDQPRAEIDPGRFAHKAIRLTPPTKPLAADPARAAKGKERFHALGCAACHEAATPLAKPLSELRKDQGCLAAEVPAKAPRFQLDAAAREAIATTLAHVRDLDAKPPAKVQVTHTLTRLGCVQCHSRDGVGGPTKENDALFTADGSAELGDQGRLPPRLDGVGDKLVPEALAKVIETGEKIRPYMRTRMPSFGPATQGLAATLGVADRVPAHDVKVEFTPESAAMGRTLVGSGGVSCITCHTTNGRASLGVPAVDLGTMHRRLRPGWFLAFLENPSAFSPGTRMTRFWLPDQRIFPELAAGDGAKQREAIWNYLSLGASMPLPPGLAVQKGQYQLVPGDEPLVFGTFLRGVSPRTFCVGYPELVHVAFDAEHGRLAKAWRGEFIDARGTWDGRAGQLESPLGEHVLDLPAGPSFAKLASRDSDPWPAQQATFRGWDRDAERRPAFAVELDGAVIRERPMPVLHSGGAWLRRAIEASFTEDRSDLWMRAAMGTSIVKQGDLYVVDGTLRVAVDAPGAIVRTIDGKQELLVPIDFKYIEGAEPRYRATFNVDMDW